MNNNKVLVAMSGGVDSAVCASLIKNQGFDTAGVTIDLSGCCSGKFSDDDINDARKTADILGIPHYVCDFSEQFTDIVIKDFMNTYIQGGTPNPCVKCNKHIKFGSLLDYAEEKGYDKIATGHYARVTQDENGRFQLLRGMDRTKDQSYVLYGLSQKQLSKCLFPLGIYTKKQIREFAKDLALPCATRQESQDICFIPDGDYVSYIKKRTDKEFPKGNFVDMDNNVLGTHSGIINYTVGQRKGLGISLGKPMYVVSKNTFDNTVVLAEDKDLFSEALTIKDINLISCDNINTPIKLFAKIRYRHNPSVATVMQTDNDTIKIEFEEPQRAIAKGQSCVLYDGDIVVGGGIIC